MLSGIWIISHFLNVPTSRSSRYIITGGNFTRSTKRQQPANPTRNTGNSLVFDKIITPRVRINFTHPQKQVAISEIECY
jgi:hypothetical protein